MANIRIYIDCGSNTENIIQGIYDGLKVEQKMTEEAALDAVDIVERGHGMSGGVVNEPITMCAILTFSATLATVIARVIEKKMEYDHQKYVLNIIIEAQERGVDVKPLLDLAKKDGGIRVDISKTLPDVAKVKVIRP